MISRLDGLFMLLDASASGVTKKAAASQIGDIQRQHPEELQTLLTKVRPYLQNPNWETRIAAGQAVESIIKNIPPWDPPGKSIQDEIIKSSIGQIRLSDFNIKEVMEKGMDLLASEGKQYELDIKNMNKEEIRQQYLLINKKLGLNSFCEATFIDDKDLINKFVSPTSKDKTMSVTEVLNCEIASQKPSLKRKNKLSNEDGADKKIKLENEAQNGVAELENQNEWPLTIFCQQLMNDLFNPVWEVRHGAATGLREVVKHHGKGAGRASWLPANQMEIVNQLWLEDLALRLICVLALDKLGDFISDQVVAPVRETSAQALGLTVGLLKPSPTLAAIHLLLQLLERPEWEARHGGLLGLKYCLAVCTDMQEELVPLVFEAVFKGLQDSEDDVSAVAAAALLPVAECLVKSLPNEVPKVLNCLWDSLLELDDLTSSTSSIVALLSSLLSHLPALNRNCPQLKELVPRLWPFLQHPSDVVRKSVLQALAMFSKNDQFKEECLPFILSDLLRLLIQQCLQEQKKELQDLTYEVWKELLQASPTDVLIAATVPFLSFWMCLPMLPDKFTLDPIMRQAWLSVPKNEKGMKSKKSTDIFTPATSHTLDTGHFCIGGKDLAGETPDQREMYVMQARIMCCRFLASLLHQLTRPGTEPVLENLYNLMLFHLNNKSALQRFCVGQVVLAHISPQPMLNIPESLVRKLMECLTDSIYYDEIALDFTRTQKDYLDFIATLRHYKVPLEDVKSAITLDQIRDVVETKIPAALKTIFLKPKLLMELESKRSFLLKMVVDTDLTHDMWNLKVQSSLAGALIALRKLPEKVNPLARPLMESIKREKNPSLQRDSASHLVHLLELRVDSASSNAKILRKLVIWYCSAEPSYSGTFTSESILTLEHMQKAAELQCFQRRPNTAGRPPRPPDGLVLPDEKEQRQMDVQRQGASAALVCAAKHFGPKLLQLLPQLEVSMLEPIHSTNPGGDEEELIMAFQLAEELGPCLHSDLHPKLVNLLDRIGECLKSSSAVVRHASSRCLGMCAQVISEQTLELLFFHILPRLDSTHILERLGAVEAVACVVERMGLSVVPFLSSLVVRLLGCMSDNCPSARLLATHCFASLVQLAPLESSGEVPVKLKSQVAADNQFLRQLSDPSKAPHYQVPSGLVKATLRPYQQRGVDWLGFLRQYRLHGVLCDDMGLGKTLQSLCLLATEHHLAKESRELQQSLVICPPTLTGHWLYEVKKFIAPECLLPLHYIGPPQERYKLREKVKSYNLLIASYDIVRNDIDFFESISWYYCILDEGHIIKNGKTKVSKALKQLRAKHRLILTGTPIQNNVLELWSLFDFLMPGFLGTEKQFTVRFSRPILQSRDAKASSKEQEAGVLAMETLHRQVLPFLLRRKKEDVLKELPPKIIQDFYCDLSPLQVRLYEDFSSSQVKYDILQHGFDLNSKDSIRKDPHVFAALQYLRNVCNHPKLVLKPGHPQYSEELISSLSDIEHASKMVALKQLLQDCGIGNGSCESVVNQHRVLIFCQLKAMLDIIEKDLFKKHLPKLSYLRLDGSVPQAQRIDLAEQFNHDPSIDVFLLTTHIGGLGLNLTGADTVIFVEHDWNPMKDYQAMDRAHRIGQKKVVNIYRLITRGTIEEKIMGLQDFKLKIVNTVITPENAQLQSMATDNLLQLFSLNPSESRNSAPRPSGLNSILQELPELWNDQQYEQEYNLASFLSLLHK